MLVLSSSVSIRLRVRMPVPKSTGRTVRAPVLYTQLIWNADKPLGDKPFE